MKCSDSKSYDTIKGAFVEGNSVTTRKEAMFYETLPEPGMVRCSLCPHRCRIPSGGTGQCGVRKNIGGLLCALNYEQIASIALDPIEKKPFRRFYPGRTILSAGTAGCNLKCPFCQNHSISRCSMEQVKTFTLDSASLVEKAMELQPEGNIGLAFTYNEPTVWFEYVYEAAKLAKENGLCNVLVTNGYICREPLEMLLPQIDAMNIDLKSFNSEFYRNTLKGGLEEVKSTILASAKKCHVEITTLVIPGVNDSKEEIGQIASFLSAISPQIPLHLSRFFPRFEWRDKPPTPVETLYELAETARRHLEFVYVGNV